MFAILAMTKLAEKPVEGYIDYSMYADDFDGQGSGHDFSGTLWMPPTGWVNNCDGGRAKSYCDYHTE